MAPRRAKLFVFGSDPRCIEIRKYIEDSGILLQVRDIEKEPLSESELSKLIGHMQTIHFVNKLSVVFEKNNLDKKMPDRIELIKLIAKDQTLLRTPIVVSNRLVTIGYDKGRISNMLQINTDGNAEEMPRDIGNRRNNRSSAHRKISVSN